VPPDPVVEAVDPAGDDPAGFVSGSELAAGEQLVFEGGEERLGGGVVQRRADPAHRLDHPEGAAGSAEEPRGVLAALVGVKDDPGDAATADGGGHPQRGHGQLGVVPVAHHEAE
jgi:hypothetical protein